jgi:hypothetical protein
VTQRASLHSSSRLLKREEKKQDKKLRIHLFDFDTFEPVRGAPALEEAAPHVLPVESLAPAMPSGYRPAAPAPAAQLAFHVHRSRVAGGLGAELPVYTEFKNKKARVSTVIRNVSGDMNAFEEQLRRVVGDRPVIKRRVASFEVFGGYHGQINEWLTRLGF